MNGRSLDPRAIRVPLFHLQLKRAPVRGTRHCDMQTLNRLVLGHSLNHLIAWQLVNAVGLHAPSKEFVFAVVPEVRIGSVLPRQDVQTVFDMVQKGPKSSVGHDLKASMKTHPRVFAVFQEYAVLCHTLKLQHLTQPLGDENCRGIALHNPWATLPCCLLPDHLPDSQEQWQVHPILGVGPALQLGIFHFEGLPWVQSNLHVTVNCPMITSKDVSILFLCLFQDVQLIGCLLATVRGERNRETKQGVSNQCTFLHWLREPLARPWPGWRHGECHVPMRRRIAQGHSLLYHRFVVNATIPLSGEALLQTTGPVFVLLVTFVATVTATFRRHAILANVRTIFDPGFHFDKTSELTSPMFIPSYDLVVAIIRGVANTNGIT